MTNRDQILDAVIRDWEIQEGIQPPSVQSIHELDRSTKKSIPMNYSQREFVDVKRMDPLGWNLPGNGLAYELCGHIWFDEGRGCLNVKNHPEFLAYVRLIGATCFRAMCPVCYQKWAGREAGRIEDKFKRLSRNNAEATVPGLGRPIHVVFSVPEIFLQMMYDDLPGLRAMVYALAERVGIKGGCSIFHPYANDKMHEESPEKILIDESTGDYDLLSMRKYYAKQGKHVNFWYKRPHFHLICYAPRNYQDLEKDPFQPEVVQAIFDETGFVTKNLGVRDSVRMTAHYQLSHCGIKSGFQAVTWFGALSNRNYHKLNPLPKSKPVKAKCPECERKLKPVLWDPTNCVRDGVVWKPRVTDPPRDPSPIWGYDEGGFWIDPGSWRYLNPGEKLHSCIVNQVGDNR